MNWVQTTISTMFWALNSIRSIPTYSLQTKSLGDFSNVMQNSQYEANIPLGQVSDRTVLNNFLGVRYLLLCSTNLTPIKCLYGYELSKTTQKITDPNGNSKKDQQTFAFPDKKCFSLCYICNLKQ